MAYCDLLLTALTYPDATPDRALRSGVALAKRLGGELTLLTVQVDIPELHNPLANALLRLDQLSQLEEARSAATARLEAVCARIAAADAGTQIRTETVTARLYEEAETIARAARTRDATLVPIGPAVLADRALAETVLFGSGRPVLVYPEGQEIAPADRFGTVAIAWDGGARAARAVADALPILRRARDVRIFIALGDKPQAVKGAAHDLVRHLSAHGVSASVDERLAHDESIGHRLADYAAATQLDLLVMGGFGHARVREFVLGGATDAMLEAPPCPVLMSH
ncbi:MAG: universal stress protein [Phenylobacterium sp.]|uniref:universal stress protein n=1 Tax=Phenylobacterium sp. TaxID=1871053 RepID=UPI00120F48BF|nr:universal stress protein [Phenylobacterium sp.]TAJ72001.1 MAG: universal stress protein [Phenylobacterium sp.]